MQHPRFPNVWQAVFILIGLLFVEIIISLFIYDYGWKFEAGDPRASGVVALLANGVVISLILHYQRTNFRQLMHSAPSSARSMFIVLGLPLALTTAGLYIVLTALETALISFWPMSEQEIRMFDRLFSGGITSVITIGLIAPFVEEMLFRGVFLRAFLQQYSTLQAIIFSATIFAAAHLNLHQMPSAFIYGCFLGWLFVKTRSLWPCILAHSLINFTALMDYSLINEGRGFDHIEMLPLPVLLTGILALVVGLRVTQRLLAPTTKQ
jgi:membrane protease YdiL (CAAX protease family)